MTNCLIVKVSGFTSMWYCLDAEKD